MANSACAAGGCLGNAVDSSNYVTSSSYQGGAYPAYRGRVTGDPGFSFYYGQNDWVGVDLGSGNAAAITTLAIHQGFDPDSPYFLPPTGHASNDFWVQFSDDAQTWTNIYHATQPQGDRSWLGSYNFLHWASTACPTPAPTTVSPTGAPKHVHFFYSNDADKLN